MRRYAFISLFPALVAALLASAIAGCGREIDVVIKPTPVKVIKETKGYGPKVVDGDLATIEYRVTLPDGKEILNDDEFKFYVNSERSTVIQGLNDTVIGMRVGGSRTINCPPRLHWGRQGYGDGAVPANTNLLIYVKVLDVRK